MGNYDVDSPSLCLQRQEKVGILCIVHLGRDGSLYLLHVIYESCETGPEWVSLVITFFILIVH